ncbi:unnamed protein product, partial [Ostreobium quekettii]
LLGHPIFSILHSLRCLASRMDGGDLLVVQPRHQAREHLQEALRLAETFSGEDCPHMEIGKSSGFRPYPSTFLGPGAVESIYGRCQELGCDRVFVNAPLSGVQLRNLERAVKCDVIDRIGLIIGIFAQRAQTKEAKLQVELAKLEYESSRLVRVMDASGMRGAFGEGREVVSARDRGSSGSSGLGGGGPGERELALQKSRIGRRKRMLKKRIEDVRKTRALQRKGRKRNNAPTVAVVGYTNAGKTTLVSKLTNKHLRSDDMLFATLDPAVKRLDLPSGKFALLVDTVGFISDLPVQLVDAFQATLEEVQEASIILHVLDASIPDVLEQRESVIQILRELGLKDEDLSERVIEVWNKADNMPDIPDLWTPGSYQSPKNEFMGEGLMSQFGRRPGRGCSARVMVSALNGFGLDALLHEVEQKVVAVTGSRPWAPS